jgi:hypothetical protein
MPIDPFNPLSSLDSSKDKNKTWIEYFSKPFVLLVVSILFGYVTMWMSINYVKQDKFSEYVKKQLESDTTQDEIMKNRYDVTQTKLETIINQQISYTEQLKAYNQLLLGIQKQVDNLDDRVKYIERSSVKK